MSIYSKNSGSVSQIAKTLNVTYYEKSGTISLNDGNITSVYNFNAGYTGHMIIYFQCIYPASYDQRQFIIIKKAGLEIARSDGKDKIGGIGPCQNLCTVTNVSSGQNISADALVNGYNGVSVNYIFHAILFHY